MGPDAVEALGRRVRDGDDAVGSDLRDGGRMRPENLVDGRERKAERLPVTEPAVEEFRRCKADFNAAPEQFDKEIWNSEAQATFSNSAFRPNNNAKDPSVAGSPTILSLLHNALRFQNENGTCCLALPSSFSFNSLAAAKIASMIFCRSASVDS